MLDVAVERRLRTSSLLSSLTDRQSQLLLESAEILSFRLGAKLCQPGAPCDFLFVIVSGKLRLLVVDSQGEESTLCLLSRQGDFVGAECLDTDSTYPYQVRTSSEATIVKLEGKLVREMASVSVGFRSQLEQAILQSYQLSFLRQTPPWSRLSHQQIQSVLPRCRTQLVKAGERVPLGPGGSGGLCTVISGLMEVEAPGAPATIKAGPGQSFGTQLLKPEGAAGEWTLSCLEDAKLLILSKDAYDEFSQLDPELSHDLSAAFWGSAGDSAPVSSDSDLDVKPPVGPGVDQNKPAQPELTEESLIPRFRRAFGKYPFVLQQSAMDCSAACLAMVSSFYGKRINMNYIRELADVGRHGTSMLALAEAAETLGFITRGLRATYDGLAQLKPPLICHWRGSHFVVLYEINPTSALIGDPARDVLRIEREEFTRAFTGFALELLPTRHLGVGAKTGTTIGRFLPVLMPYKKILFDILFASLIIQILMLATPLFTQVIVDKVLIHQSLSMLNIMLIGMVLLTIFQTAVSSLRTYFLAFTATKVDQALFAEFYRHVLSLPLRYFQQRKVGDIVTRFGENEKIRELLTGSGINVLLDVLMIGVYLALICYYNAIFCLLVLLYLLLLALVALSFTPALRSISRRAFEKEVASRSFLIESLNAIESIKSGAAERRIRWKWEELFVDSLNVRFKGALTERTAQVVSTLVNLTGSVLLLWFGAHLVIADKLSLGQLMALNMMVSRVSDPIMRLIGMWHQFQDITISFERLGDVLETEAEEPDPTTKIVVPVITGAVKFEGVTFCYSRQSDTNTLQNISFEVIPGQLVALVGRSGSGKTTMLRLIQGLYLPTSGRVSIDGLDIAHLSFPHFRAQIGVVAQNERLFSGTIRENITFNKPDASTEEVVKAAALAGIHDFINTQPAGYESILSEDGSNLSGGQRQRIAIARALLHQPRILLLDEATSFLDAESERRIQESMEKIREGRTTFVAAHRLSTIKNADLILVLDQGRIVERGTHSSLMSERDLYYYLVSQQVEL